MVSQRSKENSRIAWSRNYATGALRSLDVTLQIAEHLKLDPQQTLELLDMVRGQLKEIRQRKELPARIVDTAVNAALRAMTMKDHS